MKVLSIQRRLIVANTSASILDKFVEEGRGHVGLSGMHTCAWAPYWMTALSARCWCYRLPSSAPSWPAQTWSSQTPWRYGWAPWGRRAYHWTAALSPWRGGCASELACAAPRVRPRRAKGRMEAWGHVPRRPPPPPTPHPLHEVVGGLGMTQLVAELPGRSQFRVSGADRWPRVWPGSRRLQPRGAAHRHTAWGGYWDELRVESAQE